jgi:hypothetical protein
MVMMRPHLLRERNDREKEKKPMAKTNQAPRFVRVANVLTTTLLRAGLSLRKLERACQRLYTRSQLLRGGARET